MEPALACNVCAGVGEVAERTFVRWGMAVKFGKFAIVELSVDELKKGGAFSLVLP